MFYRDVHMNMVDITEDDASNAKSAMRETNLFAHASTSPQLKLFLKLFDISNRREEMYLPLLRSLRFLEINEDGQIRARVKIPVHERIVRPAIRPADDDILPGTLQILRRSGRLHLLQFKTILIEDESQSGGLHCEERCEEGDESAADDASDSVIQSHDRDSHHGKGCCQCVVGIHDYVGNLWYGLDRHGAAGRWEDALKEAEWILVAIVGRGCKDYRVSAAVGFARESLGRGGRLRREGEAAGRQQ